VIRLRNPSLETKSAAPTATALKLYDKKNSRIRQRDRPSRLQARRQNRGSRRKQVEFFHAVRIEEKEKFPLKGVVVKVLHHSQLELTGGLHPFY